MVDDTLRSITVQSEEFNFVSFSRDEDYREANRALLRQVFPHLPSPFFQVDVASGTGLVPQEVSRLCQEMGIRGTVFGIDPDRFALENARANTPSTSYCLIEFLEGRAQDLARLLEGKIPRLGVDYASIHDALHEIVGEGDKRGVLAAMAQILRPGGIFSYNSAFTTAAMEESAMEWGRLKARAFAVLGGKRDRQAKALKIHTPEQYRQMIIEAGLAVVHEAKRVVRISHSALQAIARYPAFVEGVFGDMVGQGAVPLKEKSRAISEAVDSLGIASIPRVWHEIIARKASSVA